MREKSYSIGGSSKFDGSAITCMRSLIPTLYSLRTLRFLLKSASIEAVVRKLPATRKDVLETVEQNYDPLDICVVMQVNNQYNESLTRVEGDSIRQGTSLRWQVH